jgi:hypothetical protein
MADETQLINRTLEFLIGDTDQIGERETAKVREYIPSKLADLAGRNIVQVTDSDDFPDEYLHWVAMALASDLGPAFGKPMDPAAITLAENNLKTHVRINRGTGAMLTVDRALLPRRSRGYVW